jgi:hypothetical protein
MQSAKDMLDESLRRYALTASVRVVCKQKIPHRSLEGAAQAMEILRQRGERGVLNVYRCLWCDCFHVGHRKSRPGSN